MVENQDFGILGQVYFLTICLMPVLVFGGAFKLMMRLAEEHIKCSQRAVYGRYVLLKINFLCFCKALMCIDLLLDKPDPVANHHDLVEKDVDGHFLALETCICRLKDQCAAGPAVAEGNDLDLMQATFQHGIQRFFDIGERDTVPACCRKATASVIFMPENSLATLRVPC